MCSATTHKCLADIASYDVTDIGRGASTKGLRAKGKDFVLWGSGVGVDLNYSKLPYDASA